MVQFYSALVKIVTGIEEKFLPAPSARLTGEDFTQRTPRRKARQGGRRSYYIWDYHCISRFILFTI